MFFLELRMFSSPVRLTVLNILCVPGLGVFSALPDSLLGFPRKEASTRSSAGCRSSMCNACNGLGFFQQLHQKQLAFISETTNQPS
mmetsp:Transcript_15670/g.37413  ORF Transcript_15670/g.37413 Transcript_15670/m.37413 type:complete len:86 (-) Transcript_15670:103-360(-)